MPSTKKPNKDDVLELFAQLLAAARKSADVIADSTADPVAVERAFQGLEAARAALVKGIAP